MIPGQGANKYNSRRNHHFPEMSKLLVTPQKGRTVEKICSFPKLIVRFMFTILPNHSTTTPSFSLSFLVQWFGSTPILLPPTPTPNQEKSATPFYDIFLILAPQPFSQKDKRQGDKAMKRTDTQAEKKNSRRLRRGIQRATV